MSCQKEGGGFGGSPRHEPHLLYTLSAVQVLALYDRLDLLDADVVATCELFPTPRRALAASSRACTLPHSCCTEQIQAGGWREVLTGMNPPDKVVLGEGQCLWQGCI